MEHRSARPSSPQKPSYPDQGNFLLVLRGGLIGMAVSLLCSLFLLLVGSLLCLRAKDPGAPVLPVGLGILYLSATVGGIFSARIQRNAPLLCGALCGALLMLLLFLLSLALSSSENRQFSFGFSLLLRLLIPFFSILGAKMGEKRKTSPKRRRKK